MTVGTPADRNSPAGLNRRAFRGGDVIAANNAAFSCFNRNDMRGYRIWLRLAANAGDANCRKQLRHFVMRLPHIHDEQLQYGAILTDAKALMEDLARQGNALPAPFADYNLSSVAELRFVDSTSKICLQAADLLAGCAMRFARDAIGRRRKLNPALRDAFFVLLGLTDELQGRVINLVFTCAALERMGVPVFRLPPWLDLDDE